MSLVGYPKQMALRSGHSVLIRPLEKGDFERLAALFQGMSAEDRMYLRHDVSNPNVIRQWTENIDLEHVIPLVALAGDAIVAQGTLHISTHGWLPPVGHLRLAIAASHQGIGLGSLLARELVSLAEHRGLEKLQAHVIEGNVGAIRMFERVGFEKVAVLKDFVKDQNARNQNLVVMVNDVSRLSQILEDWVQDTMIPGFRGAGEAFG